MTYASFLNSRLFLTPMPVNSKQRSSGRSAKSLCVASESENSDATDAAAVQIYIKIDLQDVKEPSIEVTPEGVFKFSGRVTQAKVERVYTADVRLFAPLDVKVRRALPLRPPTFLFC